MKIVHLLNVNISKTIDLNTIFVFSSQNYIRKLNVVAEIVGKITQKKYHSSSALPAEIQTCNHTILRLAHYPLHHSFTG